MTVPITKRAARTRLYVSATVAVLLPAFVAVAEPVGDLPAFPGAEGYGKLAQGGRRGRIIYVRNLLDDGPHSLRACVEAEGPRTCVFRVSGTIQLTRSLVVRGEEAAYLTIAGQTAPGGGVTLTVGPEVKTTKLTPILIKETHDVVIRHVRTRPVVAADTDGVDGYTVENSNRIYLDHVSASWATDENFNTEGDTTDITVAYSIFGEGLLNHSKCALMGSGAKKPQNLTFWRNACVSNLDRNPDNNHMYGSCVENVDNLFYNAKSEWTEIFTNETGGTPVSIVGNYYKAGPETAKLTYAVKWHDLESLGPPAIFASHNAVWAPRGSRIVFMAPGTEAHRVETPPCGIAASTFRDPSETYAQVLAKSGAFPRDAVDARLVRQIGEEGRPGKGDLRSRPGRLPEVKSGKPYADDDGDGMADLVEGRFGAVQGRWDPWEDGLGDGWTNLDRFLEWLSQERIAGRYAK